MYLKLALRNAKRSVRNYFLYITTMTILVAIMTVSDCLAVTGKMQGFQTASLPLLITLILVILAGYINRFLLKERAKEFANYLLLGMERSSLSRMFFMELLAIGLLCFVLGSLIGSGAFLLLCFLGNAGIQMSFLMQSLMQSFLYFCAAELFSGFRVKKNIDRLEIRELMIEGKRNQSTGSRLQAWRWGALSAVSLLCFTGLLLGIAWLPEAMETVMISMVSIPLLLSVFSFYKWLYHFLSVKRQTECWSLYRRDRLYVIAQMTTQRPVMSGVFCSCLIFSAMAFVIGVIMLQPGIRIFGAENQQQWMGFLQISMCIIFIVIYFSILSLQQMTELKQRAWDVRLLHSMGKDRAQIRELIRKQILIKLSVPTVMCAVHLLIAAPLVNGRLNREFPPAMQNVVLKSAGCFLICFFLLYLCYFGVVCAMCRHYVELKGSDFI